MNFNNFNETINDFQNGLSYEKDSTSIFLEWYNTFDKLIQEYINKPLKDRLIFKGYTFLVTTSYPTITTLISKLPIISSFSNYNNFSPLWYIDFSNKGNVNVLINISLNTMLIIVTSYIGDSFIQTAANSIIATMSVAQKYGYNKTIIGLVNKNTIPFYLYQNSKLLITEPFNDINSAQNYLTNSIDKYFLMIFVIGILFYLNKK